MYAHFAAAKDQEKYQGVYDDVPHQRILVDVAT
jgi:hypothetical protein